MDASQIEELHQWLFHDADTASKITPKMHALLRTLYADYRFFGALLGMMEDSEDDLSYIKKMPRTTFDTITNYITKGLKPGHFVSAVLANDLLGAFGAADMHNRRAMFYITSFIYNDVPSVAKGSREAIEQWIEFINTPESASQKEYWKKRYKEMKEKL